MSRRTAAALLFVLAAGCSAAAGGGSASASEGVPAPAPAPKGSETAAPVAPEDQETRAERLPPSRRIVGRWVMNLNEVPKEALAEELRRYKSSAELADMVRVEYTITDTEWILRKYGAGGVYDEKWHYQILKEVDDVVVLERVGDDGNTQQIQALVGDDKMMIGTGAGKVPLTRIQ